jgi:hypothetical protein
MEITRNCTDEMHKGGNQYELDISSYGETENLWNMIVGKPLVSNHMEDQDKIGRQH